MFCVRRIITTTRMKMNDRWTGFGTFLLSLSLVSCLRIPYDRRDESLAGRLREDLLRGYDKDHFPGGVTVFPEVTFMACPLLDSDGIMTNSIKEHYTWEDNRLHWDPSRYEDVHTVTVPLKNIWTPHIKLSSSTAIDDVDDLTITPELHAEVTSTGTVTVERFSHYRTRCFVSMDSFSTNLHIGDATIWECTMKFGTMKTYGGQTFEMDKSRCDSDMFGRMLDQCREVVYTRTTEFERFVFGDGTTTTHWFVVKLRLFKRP